MTLPTFLPAFTPVPRLKDRSNDWKPEVQRAFIEALADTGSVRAACRRVGRTEHDAYQLRRHAAGESFRAAWEAALALGIRRIEDIAMDRAINGVEEPVYSYGALVGTRTRYNDRLLMFLLRNRAPHRFAEGGGARGLSGLDHARLEQERQRWRKEWELEQAAAGKNVSSAQVRASIDRKIEEIRVRVEREQQREWEALSEETREAWQRFAALKERDLNSQHLLESCDRSATSGPQGQLPARSDSEDIAGAEAPAQNKDSRNYTLPPDQLPPPGWRKRKPVEKPEGPTIRSLKDEGWG